MILIISKNRKLSDAFSEMFRIMGIPSFSASPQEGLSLISPSFKCAIVVEPDLLSDKEDYLTRLRSYANLPIHAIKDTPDALDGIIFDSVIKNNLYGAQIYKALSDYSERFDTAHPGIYRLAGIDASVVINTPTYCDVAMPLTKTEALILRTLICAYPAPMSAEEIIKYVFKPTRIPESSGVRTHISLMNKKFRLITERNLILQVKSKGYVVYTPEIAEIKAH